MLVYQNTYTLKIKSKKGYHYVDFNRESDSGNPILVTHWGHSGVCQVYFKSEDQARSFADKFFSTRKQDVTFEVKRYRGIYSECKATEVETIYGPCLCISEIVHKEGCLL